MKKFKRILGYIIIYSIIIAIIIGTIQYSIQDIKYLITLIILLGSLSIIAILLLWLFGHIKFSIKYPFILNN